MYGHIITLHIIKYLYVVVIDKENDGFKMDQNIIINPYIQVRI